MLESRVLFIEDKVRQGPGMVRPTDFQVRPGPAVEPDRVLRDPRVSLYCLDFESGTGIFAVARAGTNLNGAPFLYAAQYEAAERLIEVPFESMRRLAADIVIPEDRLILIYSVGRCGSTLVSHALGTIPGCASLSEPDVFTQMLGMWGLEDLTGQGKEDLLRTCTVLQCLPTLLTGADRWALKFRSMVTSLGPMFHRIYPGAKVVFLYRNAVPWARSFLRMIGCTDPLEPVVIEETHELFGRGLPACGPAGTSVTLAEFVASMWLSPMRRTMDMQAAGVPLFLTRYEDLNHDPTRVLSAMFAFCGCGECDRDALDIILAEDSQQGSAISRENLCGGDLDFSEEHAVLLARLFEEASLPADTVLAGTAS